MAFKACLQASTDTVEAHEVGHIFYDLVDVDCFWDHEPYGCTK